MADKFKILEDNTHHIIKDILEGNPKPVYFLSGEENYYIDIISDNILHKILNESEKSFNSTTLYASDTDINQIILVANRFPMMAKYQVVVVKEAQYLKGINNKQTQELIIKYITNPNKSTILCFLFKEKALSGTSRLVKQLKASSNVVYLVSDLLLEWEVSKWVMYYLTNHQKNISFENASLIAKHIGNNRKQIVTELQKVIVNSKQTNVSKEDIIKYIGISKIYNIFELQNALLLYDIVTVMKIVSFFSKNPKNYSIQNLVENFHRMLTNLMIVVKNKNDDAYALSQKMKLPPFLVGKYYIPARRYYSFGKVVSAFSNLARMDRQLKGIETTSLNHGELLELFISKFMLA